MIKSLSLEENSLSKLDKMFYKKNFEKVLSSKYLEDEQLAYGSLLIEHEAMRKFQVVLQ